LTGEGIYYALRSGMMAAEAILQSKEKGISPSDPYQTAVHDHIFENLNGPFDGYGIILRFQLLSAE
jgi:flavin-dependent dehydrogenase